MRQAEGGFRGGDGAEIDGLHEAGAELSRRGQIDLDQSGSGRAVGVCQRGFSHVDIPLRDGGDAGVGHGSTTRGGAGEGVTLNCLGQRSGA